jgi:hypothetical protein
LQIWRFPHLSVQEYLQPESHLSISQAHLHVAKIFLSYFISSYGGADPVPGEADDYDSESSVPLDTDGGFSQMHPFHVNMVLHVHALTEADAAELSPLLKTFLGSPGESGVQYQRLYQRTAEDCDNF